MIGTKAGNQKVHEDLIRQNRILERRIKALEQALKAERFSIDLDMPKSAGQKIQHRTCLVNKKKQIHHLRRPKIPLRIVFSFAIGVYDS